MLANVYFFPNQITYSAMKEQFFSQTIEVLYCEVENVSSLIHKEHN